MVEFMDYIVNFQFGYIGVNGIRCFIQGFALSLFQRLEYFFQHEVYEDSAVGFGRATVDGIVVALLVGVYHVFDRQVLEYRM